MNWLIYGTGAIGTYIGGSLALADQAGRSLQRVVFLDRPSVAEEIRHRGLRLRLKGQEFVISSPQVVSSIEDALAVGPYDLVVFALKAYDTASALENLSPYRTNLPPFLCLQNGVENEPALEAFLGEGRVIAGTVTSAVGKIGPGHVVLERERGLGLAAGHPLSRMAAQALTEAGLKVRLYPNISDMKWSKMLTNLLANATSAILDMTPAEIFAHPGLYRLEIAQLREALKVMSAQDIRVTDLPGTPVRALALAVHLPGSLSRPILGRAVGSGRGEKMPSFHIDLHSGSKKSEVEYLNGAIWRAGERLGIPTPVNKLLTETLLALARGERSLSEYAHQPEKLLAGLLPA